MSSVVHFSNGAKRRHDLVALRDREFVVAEADAVVQPKRPSLACQALLVALFAFVVTFAVFL